MRSSDPLNTVALKSEVTSETAKDWVAGGWMAPTNTRRQRTTTQFYQPAIGSQVEEETTPKTNLPALKIIIQFSEIIHKLQKILVSSRSRCTRKAVFGMA